MAPHTFARSMRKISAAQFGMIGGLFMEDLDFVTATAVAACLVDMKRERRMKI